MEKCFCIRCKETKNVNKFYIKKNGKIHSWCIMCTKDAARASKIRRTGKLPKLELRFKLFDDYTIYEELPLFTGKVCIVCGLWKGYENYYERKGQTHDGTHNKCIECFCNQMDDYKNENREEINKKAIEKYHKDVEKSRAMRRIYYRKNSKSIIKKMGERDKERRKTDPIYALDRRVSSGIKNGLKSKAWEWDEGTSYRWKLVGCSVDFLRNYLESGGMKILDPNNHLEHIIPKNAAQTKEEYELLWHWTNLRITTAKYNLLKGVKPPKPDEIPDFIHKDIMPIYERYCNEFKP